MVKKKVKKVKKANKPVKDEDRSGLYVPAGLFVGMGIGFVMDQMPGWIFIGLGAGFLAMALSKSCKA